MIGSKIGNDKTGNKACLELAFEIIADITVVDEATATEEIAITSIINPGDLTEPEFEKIKKRNREIKFINKLRRTLKINFPK
jgi:hypothetical protein